MVGKQFIQKRLAFKQLEIAPHLSQVQLPAVGAQQLPDVIEVAVAAGVLVQRLQLEADQAFRTDHAHPLQQRLTWARTTQQVGGDRAVRVQQVKPFITAHLVRRIRAAVHAAVAERQQLAMHPIRIHRSEEEVDITRSADDLVRRQHGPVDQSRRCFQFGEDPQRLLDLVDESK